MIATRGVGGHRLAGMDGPTVRLRPLQASDFWMLERQAADPEAAGRFNWSGFKDLAGVRRQFDRDGLIGPDEGLLAVVADDEIAGKVSWAKKAYGIADWWCWSIGIALLPDHRRRGIGTIAQRLLVEYLFATTVAERIEAYTDIDNIAEQRTLERVGFTREGMIRSTQFRDGRWRDVYLYSVLRQELKPAE